MVDLQVEDVRPVCLLPCLEKLQLTGNAVTMTVDYRTKILEMFGDRVDEVKKKKRPTVKMQLIVLMRMSA